MNKLEDKTIDKVKKQFDKDLVMALLEGGGLSVGEIFLKANAVKKVLRKYKGEL